MAAFAFTHSSRNLMRWPVLMSIWFWTTSFICASVGVRSKSMSLKPSASKASAYCSRNLLFETSHCRIDAGAAVSVVVPSAAEAAAVLAVLAVLAEGVVVALALVRWK